MEFVVFFSLLSWFGGPSPNPVLGSGSYSDSLTSLVDHFYSPLLHRDWIRICSCLLLDPELSSHFVFLFHVWSLKVFMSYFWTVFTYFVVCFLFKFFLSLLFIWSMRNVSKCEFIALSSLSSCFISFCWSFNENFAVWILLITPIPHLDFCR